MKILHLYSDWKWTGPAEPVLHMCAGLAERGHDVVFAYRSPPPGFDETIEAFVKERGIKATSAFRLNRYFSVTDNLSDFVRLPRYITREGFDVVNVHLSHDHFIGGLAARLSSGKPVVIRTDHKREPLKATAGNRFMVGAFTDGLITFSEAAREEEISSFGLDGEMVARIPTVVDCERFDPSREFSDMRKELGIAADDMVVGVVARFQRYRRMETFFEAFSKAAAEVPNLKALLVGRSSHIDETVHKPIDKLGLEDKVIVPGYFTERYEDILAAMDIFVFLMAGSDGTGRAMREAMAMGKPVLASRTGMLPEMIEEGADGFVFDDAEQLSELMVRLAREKGLRISMGARGREKAVNDFSVGGQAAAIEGFYESLLERKKGSPR
ncbi:MAG: glycosyltransferase family 4 protein [Thermodesulfobacteriota bacterium]